MLLRNGENNPSDCGWKCKLNQQLWKIVWGFLKKFKIELPYDPVWRRHILTSMFIAELYTITKIPKQVSITGCWIKVMCYLHIMEYSPTLKRRTFGTKWNKTGMERQILDDLTYLYNVKKCSTYRNRKQNVSTSDWGGVLGDVGQSI
jgi:hypothetical protein